MPPWLAPTRRTLRSRSMSHPPLLFRRNNGPALHELDAINEALSEIGGRIEPLPLADQPDEIRALLREPSLDADQAETLKRHFLLSQEELLRVIAEAGRAPQVAGGGALETHVSPHDFTYPQLYQIDSEIDYGRFDQFHRNMAEDGSSAVDEILQMLHSGPLDVLHVTPGGDTIFVRLRCPDDDHGWLMTYDGSTPHSGRMGAAEMGSKALVQVIGPARWVMDYAVPQGLEP